MDGKTDAYDALDKAELYEFLQDRFDHRNRDIPFYLSEAARWGDPVLELACGTGRIALPLARAGHTVTALDLSPHMLAVLRRKAAAAGLAVETVAGDMTTFDLGRTFRLIIIAFNSLLLLPSLDLQLACLQRCRAHLDPEGAFITSIYPDHYWDETVFTADDTFSYDWTRSWDEKGVLISQSSRQRRLAAERTIIWEGRYELIDRAGTTGTIENTIRMRWDKQSELEEVLHAAGLEPVERYGSYDRRIVAGTDAAYRLIVICRAAARRNV